LNKIKTSEEHKYPISWILVNSLGKLKFSKNSYYYLVIVPIIVKLLEKIENPLTLQFGGSIVPINLELPFSWYFFYFGAVLIAIASVLYEIFCPELIKNYRNYGEFLESGQSDEYLDRVSRKYKLSYYFLTFLGDPYIEEKAKEKIKIAPKRRFEEPTYEEYEKVVDYKHNIKYQEERKNAFNKLYNQIKHKNITIAFISFGLYLLGFSAFIWVIIENIYFVIKHLN
jgi:hypothetical protein